MTKNMPIPDAMAGNSCGGIVRRMAFRTPNRVSTMNATPETKTMPRPSCQANP